MLWGEGSRSRQWEWVNELLKDDGRHDLTRKERAGGSYTARNRRKIPEKLWVERNDLDGWKMEKEKEEEVRIVEKLRRRYCKNRHVGECKCILIKIF